MDDLHAIVYVSSASYLLNESELVHLLDTARERNAKYGITGLLLYCDGRFMQYLEGSKEPLHDIFNIIKADKLHEDVHVIVDEAIPSREFASWSMAYSKLQLKDFDQLLLKSTCKDTPNPPDFIRLLSNFWKSC